MMHVSDGERRTNNTEVPFHPDQPLAPHFWEGPRQGALCVHGPALHHHLQLMPAALHRRHAEQWRCEQIYLLQPRVHPLSSLDALRV